MSTCTLHVAWDDRLAGYDSGPGHPMAPLRLELTMELARAFGLDRQKGVSIEVPPAASDGELRLIHDRAYIDAATTRPTRWTGPSWPPGKPSSRCTG